MSRIERDLNWAKVEVENKKSRVKALRSKRLCNKYARIGMETELRARKIMMKNCMRREDFAKAGEHHKVINELRAGLIRATKDHRGMAIGLASMCGDIDRLEADIQELSVALKLLREAEVKKEYVAPVLTKEESSALLEAIQGCDLGE